MNLPPKKTHTEAKTPRTSAARLADYMAASEQGKRSIATSCKYHAIARVVQHNDAKAIISNYLRTARGDLGYLKQRLESLQAKLCDDQFDADVRDHNCNYITRFMIVESSLELPDAELLRAMRAPPLALNGVMVSFTPDFLLARTTRTNKRKIGAGMLRYAKGKALPEDVAAYQSAFMCGYLEINPFEEHAEPEHKLCITIDAQTGTSFEAPGNSKYLFKEMSAACASIAERWPHIRPPAGAIL